MNVLDRMSQLFLSVFLSTASVCTGTLLDRWSLNLVATRSSERAQYSFFFIYIRGRTAVCPCGGCVWMTDGHKSVGVQIWIHSASPPDPPQP